MDLGDAEALAHRLMAEHQLNGWVFRFDHARRRLGACRYSDQCISLSKPLTLLNPESVVRDTLLHEIAHALTPGAKHGPVWRAMARQIGATPRACAAVGSVATPNAPYSLVCDHCQERIPRYRKPTGRFVCRSCLQRHRRGHGPRPTPLRLERNAL
jgi:predicted SprT family Zn-dependent metalloprotease